LGLSVYPGYCILLAKWINLSLEFQHLTYPIPGMLGWIGITSFFVSKSSGSLSAENWGAATIKSQTKIRGLQETTMQPPVAPLSVRGG